MSPMAIKRYNRPMQITKSDYMLYLKHPAWLWLKKNDKDKLPPVDETTQAIFDTGHRFEPYVESLFPEGITIAWEKDDWESYRTLPERTLQALDSGAPVIFQGRFEWQEFTFLPDIITQVSDKLLDLYEIKSSTSVNDSHIYDLAFQTVVLESLGYTVRNVSVIHVNNQYVRHGAIDVSELTICADVTEKVREQIDFTKDSMAQALATAKSKTMPDPSFDFLNTKLATKADWQAVYDNIVEYAKVMPSGPPTIDKVAIGRFINSFRYPLYFLDYETMMGLIPYFDGQRPYQQVPFQYSLHVLDSPDAELRQTEYLHSENSDPVKPLCEKLIQDCGEVGTIISWNKGFEMRCNTEMGVLYPEFAEALESINSRIVDLGEPFKPANGWYSDPRFEGSWSIKKVLPIVVPDLSYKDLDIGDGGTAQRLWMEAVLDETRAKEKDKILADLRKYCGLDTLAMVEIFHALRKVLE